MIFSLSDIQKEMFVPDENELDIFCFFKVKNSIFVPNDFWMNAIKASLKLKHSVLILGPAIDVFPSWNTSKIWEAGNEWCWLAPRAYSLISSIYPLTLKSHEDLTTFLIKSK